MTDSDILLVVERIADRLTRHQLMLVTAESCTGGQVAQTLTAMPGSSRWFERGFVTYSNLSKQEMLGVHEHTLETRGAVSEQTVVEMAEGALYHSHAQVSLAISGIAGPGGAVLDKPVGTVCFAWVAQGVPTCSVTEHFFGDREAVRRQAVERALRGVVDVLDQWEGHGQAG